MSSIGGIHVDRFQDHSPLTPVCVGVSSTGRASCLSLQPRPFVFQPHLQARTQTRTEAYILPHRHIITNRVSINVSISTFSLGIFPLEWNWVVSARQSDWHQFLPKAVPGFDSGPSLRCCIGAYITVRDGYINYYHGLICATHGGVLNLSFEAPASGDGLGCCRLFCW